MYSTILFDLDGTLLDTSPGIFATANYTMRKMGFAEVPIEHLRGFVGPPLATCFREVCKIEDSLVEEACAIYREHYEKGAMFDARVYKGIPTLLQKLAENNVRLGVATLKLESAAREILKHFNLDSYFNTVSGADRLGVLTKADIIDISLKRFPVGTSNTILMVGDTHVDLIGAKENGIDFVGVDWGFGFTLGQTSSNGFPIIHDPLELLS